MYRTTREPRNKERHIDTLANQSLAKGDKEHEINREREYGGDEEE